MAPRTEKRVATPPESPPRRIERGPGLELHAGSASAAPAPPRTCDLPPVLERVRRRIRARGLSPRTERAYVGWIRRYVRHCGGRDPSGLRLADAERFVAHLGNELGLGAQSINQAAAAVLFLHREVYGQDVGGRARALRAKPVHVLPRYATPDDVARLLAHLDPVPRLAAMIMYGGGLRLSEVIALRVKDLSLGSREIHVRGGKGSKDRTTVLARAALEPLRKRLRVVEALHARDRAVGAGWAPLPGALHRKDPRAGWDLAWQFVFPSGRITRDPKTGRAGRRPLHATVFQRAVKRAARAAQLARPLTCHVLRHCFATEMLRSGCDIRLLQRLMGHSDLQTTARYLHVLDRPGIGLVSPLDRLPPSDPDPDP